MPDKRPEDQDNEPTRIVQRPGPKNIPVQLGGGGQPPAAPTPVSPRSPLEPPPIPGGPFDPVGSNLEATQLAPKPRMEPPRRPVAPGAPPVPPVPVSPFQAAPPPPQPVAPPPVAVQPGQPPYVPPAPSVPPLPAGTVVQPGGYPPHGQPRQPTHPPMMERPMADMPMAEKPMMAERPMPAERPMMAEKPAPAAPAPAPRRPPAPVDPVVGWVVVIKGPGRGASREIYSGRNAMGADPEQLIPLDFGDPAIAPRGHAFIVYDNEGREFLIEDGKQKELVRLNGSVLSTTRPIRHGDEIRIGATTLKFVALCGPDFDWADQAAAPPASRPAPSSDPFATPDPFMAKETTGVRDAMPPKDIPPKDMAPAREPVMEKPAAEMPMMDTPAPAHDRGADEPHAMEPKPMERKPAEPGPVDPTRMWDDPSGE
ncbi:FHA domain-containing protein [Prosthecomicrobium sp. N25]|uniref:FHA domain-containing protein n=1 Tax=Prosthecomicrobium sp. N25 TaxID=3129254 RepID=UPI0030777C53